MDENEAVSRLKRGDITGLETLVCNYQTQALKAAFIITRDRHMAEDVVQTAFVKAYDKRSQFDSARPFRPWFLRIVVNDAIKSASRRARDVSLERRTGEHLLSLADLLADPQPGPEELADQAELRRAISDALASLPPGQRASLVCRYYLDLNIDETAALLETAPGTIKWLLYKARNRLHVLLRPFSPADGGRAEHKPAGHKYQEEEDGT